jgi:hypothetical protein
MRSPSIESAVSTIHWWLCVPMGSLLFLILADEVLAVGLIAFAIVASSDSLTADRTEQKSPARGVAEGPAGNSD